MLAGGAAASLVLLAARARILHQQGFAAAGQFDAAWAISMNHVSLVLGVLADVLPAGTGAHLATGPSASAHLTRMLTAAALAAAAVVCVLAMLKPVVLALFYSDAFREASRYLRWTLVGDYLKVSSWVLSIPMLAAADMRAFLAADLSAYAVFAAAAAAVGHFRGAAEGTAIAFVLMYAAHLAVCGAIAWRRYGFRPDPRTVLIWAAGLLAVVDGLGSEVEDGMKVKDGVTVSVAIATYNRAAHGAAGDRGGARSNPAPPDEIVVADDASTDPTWAVLNELAGRRARACAFFGANRIRAASRTGISRSGRRAANTSPGARTTTASHPVIWKLRSSTWRRILRSAWCTPVLSM